MKKYLLQSTLATFAIAQSLLYGSTALGADSSMASVAQPTKNQKLSSSLTSVPEPLMEATLPSAFLKCTARSNANVNPSGDVIELFEGQLLIIAKQPLKVSCRQIHIKAPKDSVLLLTANNGFTKLHSLSLEPMDVSANGYAMTLQIGEEILAADTISHLQYAAQTDGIERRIASVIHFEGSSDKLLHCEFAPLSLMRHTPIIREFFRTKHPEKKVIADRFLKTAASLAIATAGHGQYLPVGAEPVTRTK